jgi:putative ABC transport system permease protein
VRFPRRSCYLPALVLAFSVAIFATVVIAWDFLVLRPIAVSDLNRVVALSGLSTPELHDRVQWWSQARNLKALALYEAGAVEISSSAGYRSGKAAAVTQRWFEVLGWSVQAGRAFTADDYSDGSVPAAVLSSRLAKDLFGSADQGVGASLAISGVQHLVIGVMPPRHEFPKRVDIWVPKRRTPGTALSFTDGLDEGWLGRLAADAALSDVQAECESLLARLSAVEGQKTGVNYGSIISIDPLASVLSKPYRSSLYALLVGALLLLCLAGTTLATVLLAGLHDSRLAFAVKIAIGATPARILHEVAREALAIGALSGIAGGLLSYWLVRVIAPVVDAQLDPLRPLTADAWTGATSLIIGVAAGALLGLLATVPATFWASRWSDWNLASSRNEHSSTKRTRRVRNALMISQVATAMLMVVGSVNAWHAFDQSSQVALGFDHHSARLKVSLAGANREELLQRMTALTGQRPGIGSNIPVIEPTGYQFVGRTAPTIGAAQFTVDEHYFRQMGIALKRGRYFMPGDGNGVVLSEALAAAVFPGQDPVGNSLRIGGESGIREVVGIVNDVADRQLLAPVRRQFYLPVESGYMRESYDPEIVTVVVKCPGGTCAGSAAVRAVVEGSGARMIYYDQVADRLADVLAPTRLRAGIGTFYGLAGLSLALAAVYSLTAFSVATRRQETAIRVACGATPGGAMLGVVKRAAVLSAVGVIAGAALSVPLLYVARHLLVSTYAPARWEPIAVGAAIVMVGCVCATVLPARRLFRIDIRSELYRAG